MRPFLGLLLLALPGCVLGSDPVVPKDPCNPNPCTQADKTTCSNDNGQAVCLCRAGTVPRPNGTCEPLSTANCPEHAGDSAEPDDCIARAALIADSQPRMQSIEPVGDHDFFRIDATARTVYGVSVVATSGALLPRVDVFGQDGKWFAGQDGSPQVQLGFKARVNASYTVRVSHSPRDPSTATGEYTVRFAAPVTDDFGDSSTEAGAITPSPGSGNATLYSGRFEYGEDQDWFSFSVTRGLLYRVEFDTTRTVPVLAAYIREDVKSPFLTAQKPFVEFTAASSTTVFLAYSSPTGVAGGYAFKVLEFR